MTLLLKEKKCLECGVVKPRAEFRPSYQAGIEDRMTKKCRDCNGSIRSTIKKKTAKKIVKSQSFDTQLFLTFIRKSAVRHVA